MPEPTRTKELTERQAAALIDELSSKDNHEAEGIGAEFTAQAAPF